jgi:TonB family protein
MKSLSLLFSLLLVTISGFAQTEPTTTVKSAPIVETPLKDFTSSMIGFSISMPAPVRERAAKGSIDNNPVYLFEYVSLSAGTTFQVTTTFLSGSIATPDQTKKRFREVLEKVKTNPKHKWLSGGDNVLEGNPGIEYRIEVIEENSIVWSRQYFAFGKVYETTVRYPKPQPELKSCTTFMESLKILRSPYIFENLPLGLIEQTQSPARVTTPPVQWTEGIEKVAGQILVNNAIKKVTPKIPRAAVRGTVQILLVVSEEGRLISATAFSGDEELKKATLEAVNLWVFQPIQVNGKPMKVQGTIAFKFGE